MNLRNTLAYLNIDAAVAGTQATTADPRSADEWVKKWLDQKNKRLNDQRVALHKLLDFPQEVQAAYRADKKSAFEQNPKLVASGGNWAVVSPEDEIISTWDTKEEAEAAANPSWRGIRPSNGPTLGARVKKVSEVEAADIFVDEEHGDRTRSKFLKHPKPRVVQDADKMRMGDQRPSSHGQGSAGTGGVAGPSGGGSGTS